MNTNDTASYWASFIARRPEFPAGARLRDAFIAGQITRLCDCGCNSFDLQVPDGTDLPPIANTGGYGSVFEISFAARGTGPPDELGSLEILVFADERGHFAGLEVDFCGNTYPVPANLTLEANPYHTRVSAAVDA